MRIVKFTAENIKKLKAVEITPTGDLIEVTGPNGQGKSSVLDAIYYALKGAAADVPSAVVRQGEESATVKLDLGELIVTRKFLPSGSTSLVVQAANGARFPSPQRMLDDLIGALSFDPLGFIRMKPREQLESLRSVVKLDRDLDVLDGEIKRIFEERTATNRIVRELETRIAALPRVPAEIPNQPININDLIKELNEAGTFNTKREAEIARRKEIETHFTNGHATAKHWGDKAGSIFADAEEECERIRAAATKKVEEAVETRNKFMAQAMEEEKQFRALPPIPEAIDTAESLAAVSQAQAINKQVELKLKRVELQDKLKEEQAKADDQTERIESNKLLKTQTIASALMPVDGLSFGDGEVLYQGLPLAVASSAEQLRVSVALAMSANPKLRVLRVKDGSLLDEANLKLLAEMATERDYQVWVERVEDSKGRPCVVMEDGTVMVNSKGGI